MLVMSMAAQRMLVHRDKATGISFLERSYWKNAKFCTRWEQEIEQVYYGVSSMNPSFSSLVEDFFMVS